MDFCSGLYSACILVYHPPPQEYFLFSVSFWGPKDDILQRKAGLHFHKRLNLGGELFFWSLDGIFRLCLSPRQRMQIAKLSHIRLSQKDQHLGSDDTKNYWDFHDRFRTYSNQNKQPPKSQPKTSCLRIFPAWATSPSSQYGNFGPNCK